MSTPTSEYMREYRKTLPGRINVRARTIAQNMALYEFRRLHRQRWREICAQARVQAEAEMSERAS